MVGLPITQVETAFRGMTGKDFMGSNNVDDNDDYDYGFANWRYYNQESSLESKIEMHFGQGNNDGFPRYVMAESIITMTIRK